MTKHLGNDESDTRSICHEKHGVKQKRRRQVDKDLQEAKEFKDDSDKCIDIWVAVIRLHLEQENLNATYLTLSKDNALTSEEMSK